jgi:hypothetical protein
LTGHLVRSVDLLIRTRLGRPRGLADPGVRVLTLGERNPKWLQDGYVRAVRRAQWLIDRSGEGVAGFVLNHNLLGFRDDL